MIALVLPHGDPTLRLAGGPALDAGRRFVAGLVDAAGRGTLPPGDDPVDRLMARAGATALADPARSTVSRLRGLGAVLATLPAAGAGVRLRLDDLELAAGTTQSSADVLGAAAAPAPYDDAVAAACAEVPAGRPALLVVDRDQQLPAAVGAADRLRRAGSPVALTGRYATACWPVLRLLPPFAGGTLQAAPRGVDWAVADPFGAGPEPGLRWRERPADPVPAGAWAGRVSLRELVDGPSGRLDGARTVVLGLCADAGRALGRGGTAAAWERLGAAVEARRRGGTAVLAEVWLGAPGVDLAGAGEAVDRIGAVVDRVAGLRVFDWPVGWAAPEWAGRPVRLGPAGPDLARHRPLLDPPPPAAADVAAAVRSLGRPLARAGTLVPGRVAGAYLLPPPPPPTAPALDPDVVIGSRRGAGPALAVNLRTATSTRLDAPLADLVARRAGPDEVAAAVRGLPAAAVRALRDGGVLAAAP